METSLEIASRNQEKARIVAALAIAAGLSKPLVYADVGALGGIDNPVIAILKQNKRLRIIGFDPNEAECQRLRAANPDDLYLPFGVGDADGPKPLFLTAFAHCSSFLEPDMTACAGMPHQALYNVRSTPVFPVRRFESLIREGETPCPDFLKIDAQGYELNILKGFGSNLKDLLGVRLEAHLRPLYKGQALFMGIFTFMRSNGFLLRDVRLTYPFEYEVFELEAFFSPDPRTVGDRFRALKIWEMAHDIPPGRTMTVNPNGTVNWISLHV
jgi:FkbM family methyltransferase